MHYSNSFALIENKSYPLKDPFTGKEDELFVMVSSSHGILLEKHAVAEKIKVFHSKYNRAIDVHVCNINKKLLLSNIPYRIYNVRGRGIVFKKEDK